MSEQWGIVQLMGHKTLAGRITEEERFGSKIGRIDVPNGDEFVTHFFGGSSVYCVTYTTEETARESAKAGGRIDLGLYDYRERIIREYREKTEKGLPKPNDPDEGMDDDDDDDDISWRDEADLLRD